MAKSIFVPIFSSFNAKGINQAVAAMANLKNSIKGVVGAYAGFQGIQAAGAFVEGSITQAGDLQRNMMGLATVFGDSTEKMRLFSEGASKMGMSTAEAAKASTFIGTVLKGAGFSMEQTSEETQRLTTLAADLAATYGYDVQEALTGMTALFRGEYDPIEKFGVAMKQSEVNAELAANGQDKLTGAARRNAEQQIRLKLLYERSKDAQGAYARGAGTLYVEQSNLEAGFKNMQATVGTALLPVLVSLFETLQPLINEGLPPLSAAFQWLAGTLGDVIPVVLGLRDELSVAFTVIGAVVGAVIPMFTNLISLIDKYSEVITVVAVLTGAWATKVAVTNGLLALQKLLIDKDVIAKGAQITITTIATAIQYGWNAALTANPIGAMVAVIALLVVGIAALVNVTNTSTTAIDQQADSIQTADGSISGLTTSMGTYSNMAMDTVNPALDATSEKVKKLGQDFDATRESVRIYGQTLDYWTTGEGKDAQKEDPAPASTGPSAAEKAAEKRKKQIAELADTIAKAWADAKERVQKARDTFVNSTSLADAVKQRGTGDYALSTGPMFREMRKLIANSKDMAKNITKLKARGADNQLLQQIIDMGPGPGATAARELLQGGQIEEMMRLRTQLSTIGAAVGEAGNVAITGMSSTGWGSANTAMQQMVNSNNNTYNINLNRSNMSASDIVASLKRYERETGRKVLA